MNPYPGMVFDPVTRSYRAQPQGNQHDEKNFHDEAFSAIQRVHEANMEKQLEEGHQTFPKPPLGGKPVEESTTFEGDLHQAIARAFELQRILRSLHPDVKKIINFGELLNERV